MATSLAFALFASLAAGTLAFDDSCNTNVVGYWGQDSYGAGNPSDTAHLQQRLSYYCKDDSVDVFPLAFLNVFSGTGGYPAINLGNTCSPTTNNYFQGTGLLNCSFLAEDIKTCQAAGKKVTISLGGSGGGGSADSKFADTIWDMFLGGKSDTRPFGDAVLDGVDMDIEGGASSYVDFLNQLRSHYSSGSKKYYLTGAPQCPFPDSYLGSTLNAVPFDAIYVQFYNNPYCSVQSFGQSGWNFGTWDYWARRISANKDIKVYIGVPASTTAANAGAFVPVSGLEPIIQNTRENFPSFGGVMFWDESQAYMNNRFDSSIKNALKSGGSCSAFKYPACTAPAWSASGNYPQGSTVTYDNYIWKARFYGSGTPSPSDTGSWVPISACSSSGSAPPPASPSPKPSPKPTKTPAPPKTTSKAAAPPPPPKTTQPSGGGSASCSGVAAWDSSKAYTGGEEATYQGSLWKANWWSQGDAPNTTVGDWSLVKHC